MHPDPSNLTSSPGSPNEPDDLHFTPDIPTPPPPPPVPDLLTRPVGHLSSQAASDHPTAMGDTARAWGVAMDFVVTVIGMLLLGYFADKYFKTTPKITLGAMVGGFAFALYRIIRRTLADEKREAAAKGRGQTPKR